MFKLLKNFRYTQVKLTNAKLVFTQLNLSRNFSVVKCDDLNKSEDQKSEDDKLRCKLAATYRLVGLKGWDMGIYNHITIRSKEDPEHFLINPFGQLYSEITAGGLVKIDGECSVIEPGSTSYGVNIAGFTLHSAIHDARSDINAVLHVHTAEAAGISALKDGFLPITQEAIICAAGGIGYHDYEGILVDEGMKQVIKKDLDSNKILVLRNHGAAFCGETIEEAFFWLYTYMNAVKSQFVAMSSAKSIENLVIPPSRCLDQVKLLMEVGAFNQITPGGIEHGFGEMDFEAEMRDMDSKDYQTGYPYKKLPEA